MNKVACLSFQERRVKAVKELSRVLVVGGRALIYVWALEQKKNQKPSTYLNQGKQNANTYDKPTETDAQNSSTLAVHTNRTEFRQQDLLVPWHLKKKEVSDGCAKQVFHRFYHVFREGELEELVQCIEGVVIEDLYYDEGNWCVVLQKQG